MKTEKLKEWGLDERQIGMVMRENGLDIEAVKAKFSGYEALKERPRAGKSGGIGRRGAEMAGKSRRNREKLEAKVGKA